MKRILTLIAIFAMTLSAMAQSTSILRSSNNGKELKFYGSDELSKAIDEAQIGDTLYFSSGSINFDNLPRLDENQELRLWTKPLVVIGAGANTEKGGETQVSIGGDLCIRFDESIPLDQRNISFEGIYFPRNSIRPASQINRLSFINARINSFNDENPTISNPDPNDENWEKEHTYINELLVDRSLIRNLNLSERNVHNGNVTNSRLYGVSGSCSSAPEGTSFSIDHCRISELNDGFEGIVENSLIYWEWSGSGSQIKLSGICYFYNNEAQILDCVNVGGFDWEGDDIPINNGDGSINIDVSTLGTTPDFSYYPSYPTMDVKNSKIDKNPADDAITITVSVLNGN